MAEDQLDYPTDEDEAQDDQQPPQQETPSNEDKAQRDERRSQQSGQRRDGDGDDDEAERVQGGQRQQPDRRKIYGGYRRPKCNSRLDELSKPRRWYMLSTWKEYGSVFDPERMLAFKEKIQEEFSMSPEETELYFSHLRRQVRRSQRKKALERQLRKEKAAGKQQAYREFKSLLQQAMQYAFRHPPPPIVSPMIRRMSDTILEQLCEIHQAELPSRDSTDKFAVFLISLADWTAIVVGNIYYEVDVNEKLDIERIRELEQMSRTTVTKEETKDEVKKEKRSSLPQEDGQRRGSKVKREEPDVMGEEEEEEEEGGEVQEEGAIIHDGSSDDVYHLALTDDDFTEATTTEDDTEAAVKNHELEGEG